MCESIHCCRGTALFLCRVVVRLVHRFHGRPSVFAVRQLTILRPASCEAGVEHARTCDDVREVSRSLQIDNIEELPSSSQDHRSLKQLICLNSQQSGLLPLFAVRTEPCASTRSHPTLPATCASSCFFQFPRSRSFLTLPVVTRFISLASCALPFTSMHFSACRHEIHLIGFVRVRVQVRAALEERQVARNGGPAGRRATTAGHRVARPPVQPAPTPLCSGRWRRWSLCIRWSLRIRWRRRREHGSRHRALVLPRWCPSRLVHSHG